MKKTMRTALLALCATAAFSSLACSKGMEVGGSEDRPWAVETAGVPEVPKHGAQHGDDASHEAPTSPAHPLGHPTQPGTASSHESVPTTPPVLAPAGGDVRATTTGLGTHDTTGATATSSH